MSAPTRPLRVFRGPTASGAPGSLAACPPRPSCRACPALRSCWRRPSPRSAGSAGRGRTRWRRPSASPSSAVSTWPCRPAPGTGKSLAYLVPAIHHAVGKGATVVVSTATIALQRQLVDRDLPRLAKALKPLLGRAPTFAILKGRRNYLCLNKLHGGDETDPGEELFDPFAISAMGRSIKRIHEWADTTEHRRPRRARARRARLHVAPGLGHRAGVPRRGQVPGRRRLLRGEGPRRRRPGRHRRHQPRPARDRRPRGASGAARARRRGRRRGARAGRPRHRRGHRRAHRRDDQRGRAAARQADRPGRSPTGSPRRARASRLVLEDLPPGRWESLPQAAAGALSAVRDAAGACKQALGSDRREDPEAATGRKIAQASLDDVADTAVRLLGAFDEADPAKRRDVVWLAEQGPDGARHKSLHAAPLWVGGLLRERLFGRSTVVLTSATLALGGNFDALARQWGLPPEKAAAAGDADDPVPDPDAPKWSGLDVGSPFAHAKQRHPLRRQAAAPAGPRRPAAVVPRRDRRARRGRGRAHARAVLLDAGREAGHRGAARPAGDAAAVPGRGLHDAAGREVRRRRGHVAVRHAVAVAGRRRARARRCPA